MSLFKYIRHRYTKYRRAAFFGSSVPSSSGEALCVCSWESGGFQLFKCGYPYLCKTIQLQKAASCQDFFPLYYTFFFSFLFCCLFILLPDFCLILYFLLLLQHCSYKTIRLLLLHRMQRSKADCKKEQRRNRAYPQHPHWIHLYLL